MKISFNCITVLLFAILIGNQSWAQETSLTITVFKNALQPKDTLSFDAIFLINGKKPNTGTLYLKAVNQQGKIWNMRWPVFDGICQVDIAIPDSFPASHFDLYFAGTTNFFTVYGRVKSPSKVKLLKSTLLTMGKEWLVEDIPVSAEGEFQYRNKVFEDEATLFLKQNLKNNDDLNISIVSLLDSAFTPIATAVKEITIGNTKDTFTVSKQLTYTGVDSAIASQEKMLEAAIVTAKKLTRAEKFNEKYSTGLFRTMDEKLIDLLDDPTAQGSLDILNYLQGRVAGLQIRNQGYADATASWRNGPVIFYIDEMRVDIQTIKMVPISDIALVKAFPPPFFGNTFGEGGAIAIYTKRGEYIENGNRRSFRLKGYTPYVTTMTLQPTNR